MPVFGFLEEGREGGRREGTLTCSKLRFICMQFRAESSTYFLSCSIEVLLEYLQAPVVARATGSTPLAQLPKPSLKMEEVTSRELRSIFPRNIKDRSSSLGMGNVWDTHIGTDRIHPHLVY